MSRSNWLRYLTALTLQLFALGIVGQFIVGVWSQYETNRDAYRSYQQKSEQDQKKSADEIATNCAVVNQTNPALRDCLTQEIQAYQKKDATNKDLQAQQEMAFWAFVAAAVSTAGLIISIGGLCLVFQSLKQTRQAITNDREIGEAQVRAYLSVEPPEQHTPDIKPGENVLADLKIRNTGQSPAYNVRYVAALMPLQYPLANNQGDLLGPDPDAIERGVTIGAGGDTRIEASLLGVLTAADIKSIKNEGSLRLCAVVVVTYFDVFKRAERKTKFCAYLTAGVPSIHPKSGLPFTRHEWAMANTHNEAT